MIAMIPFLTIVALTVSSFALVNYSIDKDNNKKTSFFANLMLQYRILYGENTDIDFTISHFVQWFNYVGFTLLMCITMLNLLISIISDEFDRVQATQKSTDLRAKCEILNEYGQLEQFFYRNILRQKVDRGQLLYVHRFIRASDHGQHCCGESGQWMGRLKTMTIK